MPPKRSFFLFRVISLIESNQMNPSVGDSLFGRALQILKERYEPDDDTGCVPLVHDGQEGGIIRSGRPEGTVDNERRILGPGDACYFEIRRPHRFRCARAALLKRF